MVLKSIKIKIANYMLGFNKFLIKKPAIAKDAIKFQPAKLKPKNRNFASEHEITGFWNNCVMAVSRLLLRLLPEQLLKPCQKCHSTPAWNAPSPADISIVNAIMPYKYLWGKNRPIKPKKIKTHQGLRCHKHNWHGVKPPQYSNPQTMLKIPKAKSAIK